MLLMPVHQTSWNKCSPLVASPFQQTRFLSNRLRFLWQLLQVFRPIDTPPNGQIVVLDSEKSRFFRKCSVFEHSPIQVFNTIIHTHRSSTRMRHLTLFCAVPFSSFQMTCFLSNPVILICRQVCWGFPLFHFPCGFHSNALLTTSLSGQH